ncbi:MAG: hypothetical protein KAG56_06115 [Sulfurovaceae bacterium]|nr:hypothetical protein [Sulfurovaceae bacterium]
MLHYLYFFMIFTLLLTPINANELTKQMHENKAKSTVCTNPKVAKEDFTPNFGYGCFCGEDYPNIQHPSKKNYKNLTSKEREELIAQYYLMKPYDSIDRLCMNHDICYIYKGEEDQSCNDTIYHRLKELKREFKKQEDKDDPTQRQCRILVSDMASFFRTIFGIADNISLLRGGVFVMTTPMTIMSKGLQKSKGILSDKSNYPKEGIQCLIESQR